MNFVTALLAATAISTTSIPAQAQVLETVDSVVSVTLLEGWREPNGAHYAGIQIDLAPGWKTYWRAPGDGGIPTSANWEGSENLAFAQLFWPRPEVFRTFGMRSVGYADRVVLPVHIEAQESGDIDAQLQLRLGVCNEICLPVDISLSGTFPEEGIAGMVPIQAALVDRPEVVDAKLTCTLQDKGDEYRLDIATNLPPLDGLAETAVVEIADESVWISEPRFMRDEDWVLSTVRLIPQHDDVEVDLSTVRVTMLTTTSAVELRGCD